MEKSTNMYFPALENLKRVNKIEVGLLDWWVGTRKKNTWKYLNPLQFSVDCGVSEETALNLFIECTLQENINLFEVRTILRCPQCSNVLFKEIGKINLKNDVINICPECYEKIPLELIKDHLEIYFSLQTVPSPTTVSKPMPLGGEVNKAETLTIKNITHVSSKSALEKLLEL